MKPAAALLAALLALGAAGGCTDEEAPVPYGLTFEDDFAGPAGQLPDPAKWRFDVGTGWGNAQLEYDTDRAENVHLDGEGHLAITARQEDWEGRAYTSGRIKTEGLFAQARGRFEARLKLPSGRGLWPAFWLLGADVREAGWPACGEIDIMEYRGQEPRTIHGSLHGPGYAGGAAITAAHAIAQGGYDLGFHNYAIEWDEGSITWFVDGYAYLTVGRADLPAGAAWVFDRPFFILLNVAVGGNWVGPPDDSTVFPQAMLVDWVRVHGELR